MTSSQHLMPDIAPLPTGVYRHYKGKFYALVGVGEIDTWPAAPPNGSTSLRLGPAHYSEDPELRAMVFLVQDVEGGVPWRIKMMIYSKVISESPSPLYAIYTALYVEEGDNTPRLAFRPLGGAGGWTTAVDNGDGTSTPRFTYVGSRVPELVH